MDLSPWIKAARLRTLPLSFASILTGYTAARLNGYENYLLLALCLLTSLLLQILSNYANDLGDFLNSADNEKRKGEPRMVQTGRISVAQMKTAIKWLVVLSFLSGLALLFTAFPNFGKQFWLMLGAGILSILGAIYYTYGKKPYGYLGLGDLAVFIFFGIVGVAGTYFIITGQFSPQAIIPAIGQGLWAMAVLNLNNLRDIETDKEVGKLTIPVRLGLKGGKIYHMVLMAISGFILAHYPIFMPPTAGIALALMYTVYRAKEPAEFERMLKLTAISVFVLSTMGLALSFRFH